MTATQKEILHLISLDQGEWQTRNFGDEDHFGWMIAGVNEEVGELSHAILKAHQGIRNSANHLDDIKDAVADTVIYLMGAGNRLGVDFLKVINTHINPRAKYEKRGYDTIQLLSNVSTDAAKLYLSVNMAMTEKPVIDPKEVFITYAASLVISLVAVAEHYEFDFAENVDKTWMQVSTRDWKENPIDGTVATDQVGEDTEG